MNPIKAITLYRPWAGWVVRRLKTIETRMHTRLRSLVGQTIAIHAGRVFDKNAYAEATRYRPLDELSETEEHAGEIVGLAKAVAWRELGPADSKAALIDCSSVKRFGLFLEHVHALAQPIPATGHQWIWDWTPPSENGIRDIDHPCTMYQEGKHDGDCQSDGHYMCHDCVHWDGEERI